MGNLVMNNRVLKHLLLRLLLLDLVLESTAELLEFFFGVLLHLIDLVTVAKTKVRVVLRVLKDGLLATLILNGTVGFDYAFEVTPHWMATFHGALINVKGKQGLV